MLPPLTISSRRHPIVLECRRLATGRGDEAAILLDGEHLIGEAIRSHVHVRALITRSPGSDLARLAAAAGATIYAASDDVIAAASPVATPSGAVALADWIGASLDAIFAPEPALIIGLVDVQDPGNVGSAIRSADALDATAVVAIDATASPAGWKALRGAMGSTFHLPTGRARLEDVLAIARERGVRLLATSADGGVPLSDAPLDQPLLALVGNEGAGLPAALVKRADIRVRIPMRAGVESLNVAVTAAIVAYEARRRRQDVGP